MPRIKFVVFQTKRAEKRISMKDLAHSVGVSAASLSSWLHGKGFPGPANATKLAEALDVDEDDLYTFKGCGHD